MIDGRSKKFSHPSTITKLMFRGFSSFSLRKLIVAKRFDIDYPFFKKDVFN